jgi:hypothetical protein
MPSYTTTLVAFFATTALFACAASTDSTSDGSENNMTSSSSETLKYGEESPPVKATGAEVKYQFVAGVDATVQIDVNEAYVPSEGHQPLTDPPSEVELFGPGGQAVSAQKTVFPGGGQANAGTRLDATKLAAGKYTIVYKGVAPHSYWVTLRGHDSTGKDAPCDQKKGVRHNPVCGADLRCDESNICSEPGKLNAFCDTQRGGDDTCADGLVCKFSSTISHGDEGYNGSCAKQ